MIEVALVALALAPSRVQVTADEFGLSLSRLSVRSGPAIVELVNFGEDEHDLVLRRGKDRAFRIRMVAPGTVAGLELRLRPGRYALWCSLADHRRRGMHAFLVVRGR